jgi:hypothetical protein
MVSHFLFPSPEKRLSSLLWLVAAHSFVVGILLVIHPSGLIKLLGFTEFCEPFFPSQGGAFHMIMSIAYMYGAIDTRKNKNMIIYAIIVKMAAAGFLFCYYYFMDRLMIVLLSGLIDFLMGVTIWGLLGYETWYIKSADAERITTST